MEITTILPCIIILIICALYILSRTKSGEAIQTQVGHSKEKAPKSSIPEKKPVEEKKPIPKISELYHSNLKVGKEIGGSIKSVSVNSYSASQYLAVVKNISLDNYYATCCTFTLYDPILAIGIEWDNSIQVHAVDKSKKLASFGANIQKTPSLQLAWIDKVSIVSLCKGGLLYQWGVKGDLIQTINLGLGTISSISSSNYYVAVAQNSDIPLFKVEKDGKLKKHRTYKVFTDAIQSLSFYVDYLVASSKDGTVKLLKVNDEDDVNENAKALMLTLKKPVDFSKLTFQHILLASKSSVEVYIRKTKKSLVSIETNHTAGVSQVAIIGDGSILVTGGNDGEIKMFNLEKTQ